MILVPKPPAVPPLQSAARIGLALEAVLTVNKNDGSMEFGELRGQTAHGLLLNRHHDI